MADLLLTVAALAAHARVAALRSSLTHVRVRSLRCSDSAFA